MTDARYTYTAGMPAARVGWLLARARAIAGIADRDLASSLGVPLRTVRRWERGDRVPTDDEVEAIASACGTRLTELLPRRASVSYDPGTGIMRMGDQAIAMPGAVRDNDTVLGAYVAMVRRQRNLRPDQDIKVRHEDLEALSEALDLDDDDLEERLVRVIGISRTQAAALRAQLLRRRLAVPMVGMLAGLSLLGVNRIFTTATEQVKTVAGGAVTRGNPFATTTTTASTVFGLPSVITVAPTSSSAPDSPAVSETLPAVVMEESVVAPQPTVRPGPPRAPRPVVTSDPAPTDPPAVDPVTTPETAAPTTPPATETPTTTPARTEPTVAPINNPGVQETTTVPPPPTTTTTTGPNATTTTTTPTTTTTNSTRTTVGGGSTTETTQAPAPSNPPATDPPASGPPGGSTI